MKVLCALFSVLFFTNAAVAEIVGLGRNVYDGDTFDIALPGRTVKIRICGIDAPESGQPGSNEAWSKLSAIVHGKTVSCVQVNSAPGTVCDGRSKATNRDRIVAQCFVEGQDIAAQLVKAGVACDWAKFSGGHYGSLPNARVCNRD